jgi:hypothetical protein
MISEIQPGAGNPAAPTYRLKIVLLGSKPMIWRRLQVPGNSTLGWLHVVVQVSMGWTNSHLHHFVTSAGLFSDPRQRDGMDFTDVPEGNEFKATLEQVAPEEGTKFGYEYDFGDSWSHVIMVEKILPSDAAESKVAVCLDGARACPPEDCGGLPGYESLLKALKNPKHPQHKTLLSWLGRPFDPEAFDPVKMNTWLKKLKWPLVTDSQLARVLMGRDGIPD